MQKHKSVDPDTVGNHNICLHEKNDEINFMYGIKLDDSSEGIQQFPLLTASAAIFSVSMIFLTNLSRQLHFCYSFTQDLFFASNHGWRMVLILL
jgi:ABC-type multidrug transport system permease subunit